MKKLQASRATSLGRSSPMCARQITGTSAAARMAGSIPAVCGSWRITTSPGRSISTSAAALAAHRRSYALRSASPRGPPSPSAPCSRLCRRLVRRKNSASPSMTTQRPSTPGSADVADQRAQHLRDAAPERRRVHVPDRARAEQLMPPRDRTLERRQRIRRQHLGEALRAQWRDLDAFEWHAASLLQRRP